MVFGAVDILYFRLQYIVHTHGERCTVGSTLLCLRSTCLEYDVHPSGEPVARMRPLDVAARIGPRGCGVCSCRLGRSGIGFLVQIGRPPRVVCLLTYSLYTVLYEGNITGLLVLLVHCRLGGWFVFCRVLIFIVRRVRRLRRRRSLCPVPPAGCRHPHNGYDGKDRCCAHLQCSCCAVREMGWIKSYQIVVRASYSFRA